MKASMMKRLFCLLLVLSMTFVLLVATGCSKKDDEGKGNGNGGGGSKLDASEGRQDFIDGIGGVSDTYAGAVSEETFETANDAAEAYVAAEVVGTSKVAVIKSATSKGTLSEGEITNLNLPAELSEGMDSVEKIEIVYSESDKTVASTVALASVSTKKVIVYVIKYGTEYKYFSPVPVKGDTITKSYYESVFDDEKYENCTYVNESYVKATASVNVGGQTQTQTYEMTLTQTIKRTKDKIYFKQTIVGDAASMGVYGDTYLEGYIEKAEDGSTKTWVKQSENGQWVEGYLTNLDPFAGQDRLDYSYFSKTDFGFALKGENALRYYKSAATNASRIPDDAKLDLYAEYYVNEGVLSGMRMEYSADMDVEQNGYTVKNITHGLNKMTCTDYGTTVVESPFAQ